MHESFDIHTKIGTDLILILMNVDETGRVPLYMAQILRILRDMATASTRFDYNEFKQRISMTRFEPMQQNHLDIRLGVLESFLDLTGTFHNEMVFKPGEITIMDMSCPFVDVNTACIMFRCGLQHYLQSQASGKLVVLDEAHKVSKSLYSGEPHLPSHPVVHA